MPVKSIQGDCNAPLLSAPQLAALIVAGMLTACGGGSGGGDDKPPPVVPDTHTVTVEAGANGRISPDGNVTVNPGNTAAFTVTPDTGYLIESVSGCNGNLDGTTYTAGRITADCTVTASFKPEPIGTPSYIVTASAGEHGVISPAGRSTVSHGDTASFTVTPNDNYLIDSVTGCNGRLDGTTYTTGSITENCTVSATFTLDRPPAADPVLIYTPVKGFRFDWSDVTGATHYRLLEDPDRGSGFTRVGDDIPQGVGTVTLTVPLYKRLNARYILQSCKDGDKCTNSGEVSVSGHLEESIGYFKASNTGEDDSFGGAISLSGDGKTLAIGAYGEDSDATGIDGDQGNLPPPPPRQTPDWAFGAVYLFVRDGASWTQQAYIKASNTGEEDCFGIAVSLSDDGDTLAVGAFGEDSSATGVNGDQADNSARFSGAVYVFVRDGASWTQQAYLKASNTDARDEFGDAISLSGDGNTLAVGAYREDSPVTGINGDQGNLPPSGSFEDWDFGAVYVFVRDGSRWTQQAYIKASNTGEEDYFGDAVALSDDGDTLAVGAWKEDSPATGVNGEQHDDIFTLIAGAVYVFVREAGVWTQREYVKASNTSEDDEFGFSVSLSGDGDTLAVGAVGEDSSASGVNGDQADDGADDSGAVYVY